MGSWPIQDATTRFVELLDVTLRDGPQFVTRQGVETAVLVPIEEWRRLQHGDHPSLKDILLSREPRVDLEDPPRRKPRRRSTLDL